MYNGPDILLTDRQRGDRKRHTDRLRHCLGRRQTNSLTKLIEIQKHTDGHFQHCWGNLTDRQTSPEGRETRQALRDRIDNTKCLTSGTISLTLPKLFVVKIQYLDFQKYQKFSFLDVYRTVCDKNFGHWKRQRQRTKKRKELGESNFNEHSITQHH